MYRDATGMFKQTKFVFLATALINLILSIALGKIWGLLGILLATLIARLCTNFWYEPFIIYKYYFNKKSKGYFLEQIIRIIFIAALVGMYNLLFSLIPLNIWTFILESVTCGIMTIVGMWLYIRKKEEYRYIYNNLIKNILIRIRIIKK